MLAHIDVNNSKPMMKSSINTISIETCPAEVSINIWKLSYLNLCFESVYF